MYNQALIIPNKYILSHAYTMTSRIIDSIHIITSICENFQTFRLFYYSI